MKQLKILSMTRLLTFLFFIVTAFSEVFSAETTLPPRPEAVQKIIDRTFSGLTSYSDSWLYDGSAVSDYGLAGISSYAWLESFVKEHSERKSFYVLDIGAGKCSYGSGLRDFILGKTWAEGKVFHIVSLNGEELRNPGITRHEARATKILEYRLARFKIENLKESLIERKLPRKFDLIVSHWCLRHLVDPVRVLWEAYESLNVSGILLTNGFFISDSPKRFLKSDSSRPICWSMKIEDLLLSAKIPYLKQRNGACRNIDDFVLFKDSAERKKFPLEYLGDTTDLGSRRQCHSECMTCYQYLPSLVDGITEESEDTTMEFLHAPEGIEYLGSRVLFDKLRPFVLIAMKWRVESWHKRIQKNFAKFLVLEEKLKSPFLTKEDRLSLEKKLLTLKKKEQSVIRNLEFLSPGFDRQERLRRRGYQVIKNNITAYVTREGFSPYVFLF